MYLQEKVVEQNASGYHQTIKQKTTINLTGEEARVYIQHHKLLELQRFINGLKSDPVTNFKNILSLIENSRIEKLLPPDKCFDSIFKYATDDNADAKFVAAKIILKCLQIGKRPYIIMNHLEATVKLANYCSKQPCQEVVQTGIAILQVLIESGEDTSEAVLKLEGLGAIIDNCSSTDFKTLEKCSMAILKAVMYGGHQVETHLMKLDALHKWFVPMMNIYENKTIKFFAYLAIAYLRSVCRRDQEIFRCGILDDVMSWISDDATHNFLLNNAKLDQTDKKKDLKKLMLLLGRSCKISQTLGSFLVCREIYFCGNVNPKAICYEIGVVQSLKRIALLSNATARKFAISALDRLGETFPSAAPAELNEWRPSEVQTWMKVFQLEEYSDRFSEVNGERLLKLKESELKERFFILDYDDRKLFLSEQSHLKAIKCHPQRSLHVFSDVFQQFAIKSNCNSVQNEDVSQKKVKHKADAIVEVQPMVSIANESSEPPKVVATINTAFETKIRTKKKFDIFISYRRSSGSELASLLSLRLSWKNYKIFFDVESLRAGNFGDGLMENVQQSRNFILVLTPNALDRCLDDPEGKDWVRKEIEMAIKSDCNIIPIMKDFDSSVFERENIPQEVKLLQLINSISWHHDAQVGFLT